MQVALEQATPYSAGPVPMVRLAGPGRRCWPYDTAPAPEIERMRQVGRMELRLMQHATALNGGGSVQMLIWLGKQRLGQSDQAERSDAGGSFLVITAGKMDPTDWKAAWAIGSRVEPTKAQVAGAGPSLDARDFNAFHPTMR